MGEWKIKVDLKADDRKRILPLKKKNFTFKEKDCDLEIWTGIQICSIY
jgi:hypothetical protein